MKKMPVLLLFSLGLLGTILSVGCVTEDRYITTFTPEQKVPRHLDMTYDGPRANIAVGDFQVKARNATNYIGDGLREMLQTALFESRRFNVMDRLDSEGMTAEQMLSYSKMARKGSKKLGRQMEIAELLINGAAIKTIAVESVDVEAALKAKEMLGLQEYENVNYLLAIKRILGMVPLPE